MAKQIFPYGLVSKNLILKDTYLHFLDPPPKDSELHKKVVGSKSSVQDSQEASHHTLSKMLF
jgi:hypothetical protein